MKSLQAGAVQSALQYAPPFSGPWSQASFSSTMPLPHTAVFGPVVDGAVVCPVGSAVGSAVGSVVGTVVGVPVRSPDPLASVVVVVRSAPDVPEVVASPVVGVVAPVVAPGSPVPVEPVSD